MAFVVLAKPDVALFADVAGTRLEVDHLLTADLYDSFDGALVHFDGGDAQLPVEYRGQGRSAGLQCLVRFTGREHERLVAFDALLRTARSAADGRLQVRTNAGQEPGFDGAYVGVVRSWSRPRLIGIAYDVTFRLDLVDSTVEV
jgi:hypothetical protein